MISSSSHALALPGRDRALSTLGCCNVCKPTAPAVPVALFECSIGVELRKAPDEYIASDVPSRTCRRSAAFSGTPQPLKLIVGS